MSADLHERLADLADEAPTSVDGTGLWQRGRRRHRARQAGAVAAVAAAALAVFVAVPSLPDRDPEPSPLAPSTGLRLPDTFYGPSNWLASTDDKGEIGPLVAVVTGWRDGLFEEGRAGVAGVSSTGEYLFLDAPGLERGNLTDLDDRVALSPDGRQLAYWVFERDQEGYDIFGDLAVYDTVTGEVSRLGLEAEHGFASGPLVWVSDEELLFNALALIAPPVNNTLGADEEGVRSWNIRTGETRQPKRPLDLLDVSAGPAGVLVTSQGKSVIIRPFDGPRRTVRLSRGLDGGVHLSPDGRRIAGTALPQNCPCPLLTIPVDTSKVVAPRTVESGSVDYVFGWRDDHHVVVLREGRGKYAGTAEYASVDVRNGESERLSGVAGSIGSGNVHVAADAWRAATFDAPAPDSPTDPRLGVAVGVVAMLLGLGGLVLWRRRG